MVDDSTIEAAAKAIFECVEPRLNRTRPRTWDSLTDYRKLCYKAEARAALEAAERSIPKLN